MARKRRKSQLSASPAGPAFETPATTELQRSFRRLTRDQSRAARAANAGEPTPEQLRRNHYAPTRTHDPATGFPIIVKRNATAYAVDRYLARNMIDDRQHRAAKRYREDYDRGGYERSITGNYEGGGGSGCGSPNYSGLLAANNAQLDARRRLREARSTLPVRLVAAFDAVVLHEDEAQIVGEREGRTGTMAARFVLEYLRICGDILADYYRL